MLAASFLPDLALLVGPLASFFGPLWHPTVPAVGVLMLLHVVAAVITVGLLSLPFRTGRPA